MSFPKRKMKLRTPQALTAERGGNVAITFALSFIPIMFGCGMTIDYVDATQRRLRMNAVADATALFAVSPTQLQQTEAVAAAAAKIFFDAQATETKGVQYQPLSVNVTIPPDAVVNGTKSRTVNVSYSAKSNNAFGGVLGLNQINIAGTAASTATFAPNIDFYLLLDTSPSMGIAATSADITKMMALTPKQGNPGPGCAFGCHESNAAQYDTGLKNPGGVDNYTLAKQNGVKLRIDLVNSAVQSVISNIKSNTAKVQYRMGAYTFDYFFSQLAPDPKISSNHVTSDLNSVQSLTSNLQTVTLFKPNWITSTINDGEADTNFDAAMSSINAIIPNPGNGTNALGDTPQAVLFIVSDGLTDEPTGSVGSRSMVPVDKRSNWCSQIKARNIRIAYLYTTYVPLPSDNFYVSNISSFQSQIGSVYAKGCASQGLYTEVDSDGDITSAMQNLFNAASKTAHLTQ